MKSLKRINSNRFGLYLSTILLFFASVVLLAYISKNLNPLPLALLSLALFAFGFCLSPLLLLQLFSADPEKSPLDFFIKLAPSASILKEKIHSLQESSLQNELQYNTLTENLAAAIIIRDVSGMILYCSPYTEILTGYSLDEIYEKADTFLEEIVFEEDREKVARSLNVSKYGEAFQFRYRFYHKTGLLLWAETRTVPLLDEAGETQALLSTTFDVTGTMRYQEKVEEHNKDLREFSYMLSHDLKGPIVTIQGMLTALEEDYSAELSSEVKDLLQHTHSAADRLLILVKSILEYSRISNLASQQQTIDCNEIVSAVLSEKSLQLKDIGAEVKHDSLPLVWGDSNMLYQVFLNLIDNAIKYRDSSRPLQLSIERSVDNNKHDITIHIKDNGSGIPDSRLEDVFRPFQRAHSNEIEGSGIGLACVHKLVERLGGKISAENNAEGGACFILSLRSAENQEHRNTADLTE